MKIVELRANGFARLSAVAIRPDGSLVQITGKNSQGKSSVLRAIWTALAGRAAAPATPINKNAEEARLRLDLGEMVVTRTFRRGKDGADITSDLKVTLAGGGRVGTKPQAMIDALLGDLSFDPLEFARLKPSEQFDRVKALVPGFDFAGNAAERMLAFTERTEANRAAKAARARADGIRLPPGGKPKIESAADLIDKLEHANATNRSIDIEAGRRAEEDRLIERMLDEAEQLRARAATVEKEAQTRQKKLDALEPLPPPVDIGPIKAALGAAENARGVIVLIENRERHEREAEEAERLAATLTAFIETCDRQRHEAVSKAKMPINNLSFGDDAVLLNGLPFADAGTAEKIRASVAIGMHLNPQLRVMLIDEGSELDADSLALVAEMAEANDFQVWVARVDEGGEAGFVIVDGSVKEEDT